LQEETALPMLEPEHELSPVQDGPTTYGIVASKQAPPLLQELSLQT